MNLTDLAILDWVLINNTPHRIQAIDSIDAEMQADDELYYIGEDRCHSEDKIEGIPLTPEILEKNGIKNRDDKYIISGQDDAGQWYITLKDFKPQFDFWFIKSSNRNLNVRGQIRYVHEFQHVLRLVGLIELANNFKI